MVAEPPAKPPQDVPAALKDDVSSLHHSVQVLFVSKQIPWFIQAQMAKDGYTTMEDLACRWTSPEKAREDCAKDLKFKDGENGFDAPTSNFSAMRLYQAVLQANNIFQSGKFTGGPDSPSKMATGSNLDALCDRVALEKDWVTSTGLPKPRLEYQGSDSFLKKQFKYCARGEIGYFAPKHIISALPEEGERPTKSHRKYTVDGFEKEEEEEERANPQTRRHLERMHTVFRNNLLMCTLAFPQFHQFDIKKSDLDARQRMQRRSASANISELCPGPMAAIDEGDKIRTIYDGSWGGANAHIQANCLERTTAPTVMDCLHGIHWLQASQKEPQAKKLPYAHWDWPKKDDQWMLLKADVTKAHRRVKILPAEWKYQVARLGSEWWINKVGTYGMASAQLYWGRAAALLLRILYKVFPMVDWGFVFVDDFCWLLRKTTSELLTTALLLFLTAFGCPLSWEKTAIGASNTWLGFVVTPHLQLVRMAPTKHELVMAILTKMMANDSFTRSELDSALGRLQWATTCCPLTKPFLQSFWQWKSAVKTSGKPGKLLRGFAHLLHSLFAKDYNHPSPYAPRSEWWGASDASANDEEAYVGGWHTNLSDPLKAQVWWFHYQVTRDRHPWAFKDLKPKRRASLEMFGTLLLTMYLCEKSASTRGQVILPLVSDNQGNVYGLLNDYTKKMPTAGLLMEIMFQLTAHSCSLDGLPCETGPQSMG